MVSQKIYPNYADNYYYNLGDSFIILKRTLCVYGGEPIYQRIIKFSTPQEAKNYFDNNCGA